MHGYSTAHTKFYKHYSGAYPMYMYQGYLWVPPLVQIHVYDWQTPLPMGIPV